MKKLWLHALDQARSAIPIVAVAGLAAFTWWLVQSTPRSNGPARAAAASSAPDYELEQARVERFAPKGQLVSVLDGRVMRHYVDGDRLVIDEVRLSARDDAGKRLQAVARQGFADGVNQTVTLKGGARAVAFAEPGAKGLASSPVTFEGEILKADNRSQVLSSDQPVRLLHEAGVVRGGSMLHDQRTGITEFHQHVSGYYDALRR